MNWDIPERTRKRVMSPAYLGWTLVSIFFALFLRAIHTQFPMLGNFRDLIYIHVFFVCYILAYGGEPKANE